MTLQELIGIFRNRHGYSLEAVGDFCGVSKSTVSRWESGQIKNIQKDKKDLLSELFSIDVEDYLNNRFFLPILGCVRAGYHHIAQEEVSNYIEVSKKDYDQGNYYLEVVGDSMIDDRIYEGDLVLIQQGRSIQNGDIALVLIDDEEVTIKRFYKEKDSLLLKAANPDYEDQRFSAQEVQDGRIQILGKVLSVRLEFS